MAAARGHCKLGGQAQTNVVAPAVAAVSQVPTAIEKRGCPSGGQRAAGGCADVGTTRLTVGNFVEQHIAEPYHEQGIKGLAGQGTDVPSSNLEQVATLPAFAQTLPSNLAEIASLVMTGGATTEHGVDIGRGTQALLGAAVPVAARGRAPR